MNSLIGVRKCGHGAKSIDSDLNDTKQYRYKNAKHLGEMIVGSLTVTI